MARYLADLSVGVRIAVGRNRSSMLELAVLGILHQNPMHGYELRRQLSSLDRKSVV